MNLFYKKKISKIEVISPSKSYFKKIEKSFYFLKKYDKKNYEKVSKYLKTILIYPCSKSYNKMVAQERTWLVGYNIFADKSFDSLYIASLLIHEMYHITQYLSGHKNYGYKAEKTAYLQQRKFLKMTKYDSAVKWLDAHYQNKWWKKMWSEKITENKIDIFFDKYKNGKLKII